MTTPTTQPPRYQVNPLTHSYGSLDQIAISGTQIALRFLNSPKVVHIDQARITTLKHSACVEKIAIAENGTVASTCLTQKFYLWIGGQQKAFATKADVVDIALSQDGQRVAVAEVSGSLTICQPSGKAVIQRMARGTSNCLAFSPERMARGTPNCLAFSPDGTILVAGMTNGQISILDAKDKFLGTLEGSSLRVDSVALSADGWLIAAAASQNTLFLWQDGELHKQMQAPHPTIALSDRNDLCATIDHKQNALIFRGDQKCTVKHDNLIAVQLSQDGSTLLTRSEHEIRLWLTDKLIQTIQTTHPIAHTALSEDGKTVVVADDRSQEVWVLRRTPPPATPPPDPQEESPPSK